MEKYVKQLLLIPLLLITSIGHSSTYFSYVYELVQETTLQHIYKFQIDYWEPDSIEEPNPCVTVLGASGNRNCYFTINHLHSGKTQGGTASRNSWTCNINFASYKTMASIIADAKSKCNLSFPYRSESRHTGSITTDECVGFFLGITNNHGRGKILPGGICGISPPPAGKCYFVSPNGNGNNLELDHGSLNSNELNGNTQVSQFDVICNTDTNIRISSNLQTEDVNLRPDGSLKSHITLNNKPSNNGIVMLVKANKTLTVNIKSVLKANGAVAPGEFNGSITLVISIP